MSNPRQQSMPFATRAPRERKPCTSQAITHEARNAECAALILARPGWYGGERALAVEWARRVVAETAKWAAMEARKAYRATLDPTGRGSDAAYAAMEQAEAAWDLARGEAAK